MFLKPDISTDVFTVKTDREVVEGTRYGRAGTLLAGNGSLELTVMPFPVLRAHVYIPKPPRKWHPGVTSI